MIHKIGDIEKDEFDNQTTIIDGKKFTSWNSSSFWQPEEKGEKIICKCGNDTFYNYYGYWEVSCICSKCKESSSLYSG